MWIRTHESRNIMWPLERQSYTNLIRAELKVRITKKKADKDKLIVQLSA